MIVETFPSGPLGCNCTILGDITTKSAVVIDPGGDFPHIEARLAALGLTPKVILHTHTHIDHVGATAPLQRTSHAPAKIHEADNFLYEMLPIQAQMLGLGRAPEMCELEWIRDGEVLTFGDLQVHVLHTPGHTPGSCCFEVRDRVGAEKGPADDHAILFSGDTLFQRSVGRTDLWGGDQSKLLSSIRQKLFALPDPTRVVCGHGDDTTIGLEKRLNPFVRIKS